MKLILENVRNNTRKHDNIPNKICTKCKKHIHCCSVTLVSSPYVLKKINRKGLQNRNDKEIKINLIYCCNVCLSSVINMTALAL